MVACFGLIMETAKLHKEIVKGYASSTAREWKRLALRNGIMKYITTVRYLEGYMPEGKALVADIGSSPEGIHSGLRSTAMMLWL